MNSITWTSADDAHARFHEDTAYRVFYRRHGHLGGTGFPAGTLAHAIKGAAMRALKANALRHAEYVRQDRHRRGIQHY